MNHSGILKRHRLKVILHGNIDAAIFFAAFGLGAFLRLGVDLWTEKFLVNLPLILAAAFVFVIVAYIAGLYDYSHDRLKTSFAYALALCFLLATAVLLGLLYVTSYSRIGRGVLLISALLGYAGCLLHHALLQRWRRTERDRTAILVTNPDDEQKASQMLDFWQDDFHFVGLIHIDSYVLRDRLRSLGPASQLAEILQRHQIERLICSEDCTRLSAMRQPLCIALYSGILVTPLLVVFEELHHCIPLDLLRPDWLLNASSEPKRFYLLKAKRAFDVLVSLALLVLCTPLLLLIMLLVRLTSPGPIFYHQMRCGRFGRLIRITKFRTMRVNAEPAGAVWAAPRDARLTPIGGFLRKYRMDELIQLFSVLKGEMSFVGPRPERPEFMCELERAIPSFSDRLLIHPGLTGWAQVNYPYGASIEDTRRKLEFDFYYMKHMSLDLDIFIILDTIRTVLSGGTREPEPVLRFKPQTDGVPDPQVTLLENLRAELQPAAQSR